MNNLEKLTSELEYWFDELKIDDIEKTYLRKTIREIAKVDEYTATHSLKIAFLLARSEDRKCFDVNFKDALYTGITHDIGKVLVDPKTLEKTNDIIKSKTWGKLDEEKMKIHPLLTYLIVNPKNPHSANISLRHHLYQNNPYPENIPVQAIQYAKENPIVIEKSKILSVSDCYHACKRNNNFHGEKEMTSEKIKELMYIQRPDCSKIIDTFYSNGIFE